MTGYCKHRGVLSRKGIVEWSRFAGVKSTCDGNQAIRGVLGRRGQITFDFMVALGLALVMFILMLNAVYNLERQAREAVDAVEARTLVNDFAVNINSVYLSGENASRSFSLPETLSGGIPYSLRTYGDSLVISFERGQVHYYSVNILGGRLDSTGLDDLAGRELVISRSQGVVYLEQA